MRGKRKEDCRLVGAREFVERATDCVEVNEVWFLEHILNMGKSKSSGLGLHRRTLQEIISKSSNSASKTMMAGCSLLHPMK